VEQELQVILGYEGGFYSLSKLSTIIAPIEAGIAITSKREIADEVSV
jgi:hypothetical protein